MKNILLVIDMQEGFCRCEETRKVSEKIKELLELNTFDYTIATKFINLENGPYRRILKWNNLSESPQTDLVCGIKADAVLEKNVYTPINEEMLEELKKANDGQKPDYVFISGVDTDCCILKTAVDLFEMDIIPIVLLNYCNSNGGEIANEAGIQVMKRLIGKSQLVTDEIKSLEDVKNIINKII